MDPKWITKPVMPPHVMSDFAASKVNKAERNEAINIELFFSSIRSLIFKKVFT